MHKLRYIVSLATAHTHAFPPTAAVAPQLRSSAAPQTYKFFLLFYVYVLNILRFFLAYRTNMFWLSRLRPTGHRTRTKQTLKLKYLCLPEEKNHKYLNVLR